jgi:hypothetical protein
MRVVPWLLTFIQQNGAGRKVTAALANHILKALRKFGTVRQSQWRVVVEWMM